MSVQPPDPLFDTAALVRNRDRAQVLGFDGSGDFLHRAVADMMAERLAEVTRSFSDAAVIGSGGGLHAANLSAQTATVQQIEISPHRAAVSGVDPAKGLDPLPLAAQSLDLVVSALELHWANDLVGQLIQMRRALRPDGLMLAALFGGQTLVELRTALAEAEVEITSGLSPRVAPMAEIRDLGGLLQRAGFTLPVADIDRLEVTYATPVALMQDLRRMGETNVLSTRPRRFLRREILTRACEIYAEAFPARDGRVRATFEIVFLTGWAPADTQPQPLRPGSAQARLADALGTSEHPLPRK